MPPESSSPPVPLPVVFRVWLQIGAQAFGGGATLLLLLRREIVDKQGWLTEEELTTAWSLCGITPGINQIAIAALIGQRVRGLVGAIVSALGLLTVGALATIALTLGYHQVQNLAGGHIKTALHGLVPATIGVGLLTCWQLLRPQLVPKSGSTPDAAVALPVRVGQVQALVLSVAAGVALTLTHLPVVLILLTAGSVGALTAWIASRQTGTHVGKTPT